MNGREMKYINICLRTNLGDRYVFFFEEEEEMLGESTESAARRAGVVFDDVFIID